MGDTAWIHENVIIRFQIIFKERDQLYSDNAELEGFELGPDSTELEERIVYIWADSAEAN